MKVKKVGRPPMFHNPEELQKKIQNYFDKGVHHKELIVTNKKSLFLPVPTITGLALYCGFANRYSFYEYEKKPEFTYTIKRARAAIERHYEQLLQGNNPTGAIFALKNFGWKDTPLIDQSTKHSIQIINYGKEHPSPDKSVQRATTRLAI